VALARIWLERWAPEDAKFSVLPRLPDELPLSDKQKAYLAEVRGLVGKVSDPEAMQEELYEAAKRVTLTHDNKVSKDAFAAIYLAFLGKPSGPKAAWLLTTLPPDVVRARLEAAAR
jgi:lysyl-tRNA synthetase class 1